MATRGSWLVLLVGASVAPFAPAAAAQPKPEAPPAGTPAPEGDPPLEDQVRELEERVVAQEARIAELERSGAGEPPPTAAAEGRHHAHTPTSAPVDQAQRDEPLSLLTSKDLIEAMLGESANVDGSWGRATRLAGMAMYSF